MTNKERQASLENKVKQNRELSGHQIYCEFCEWNYKPILAYACNSFYRCKHDECRCAKAYNRMVRKQGIKKEIKEE